MKMVMVMAWAAGARAMITKRGMARKRVIMMAARAMAMRLRELMMLQS
jgi:hypothetical protein